jgi:hypothetical protein
VNARVLIVSDYNSKERAHFALSYEFCRIIAACDDADVIAPPIYNYINKYLGRFLPPHDDLNVQNDFNRLVNGARKVFRLRNGPTFDPVEITKDYELFVYVAWSPQSLVELSRLRNWRQRCSKAVIYMHELWASTIEQNKEYLKILDQFDHVFLLHRASVEKLQQYTNAPCSFMPTGTDCLLATPYPSPPERSIDVYSIGNRPAGLHRQLIDLAEDQEIFYLYDSLASSNSRVKDWREHRLLITNNIKRSRYFVAFSPASLASHKVREVQNEQVVPTRLFEGAAGGAVMIGQAPDCPEYHELFDWPDAVIPVPVDPVDIRSILKELDSQPQRIDRLRHTNAVQSLRRHDWAYRWENMLSAVGIEASPKLGERKARLRNIADAAEASFRGVAPSLVVGQVRS